MLTLLQKTILQLKLKLGMSINPCISDTLLSALNISGGKSTGQIAMVIVRLNEVIEHRDDEMLRKELINSINLFDISFLDVKW